MVNDTVFSKNDELILRIGCDITFNALLLFSLQNTEYKLLNTGMWTTTPPSLHQGLSLGENLGAVHTVCLEDVVEPRRGSQDVGLVLHGPRVVSSFQAEQLEILLQ